MAALWRWTGAPSLAAVRDVRSGLDIALAALGLDDEPRQGALLAVSEILTNLVQHAEPTPSSVGVALHGRPDAWSIRITDDGGPFGDFKNYRAAPPILGENGMGLALVLDFFPDAAYEAGGDGALNLFLLPYRHRARVALIDDDPIGLEIVETFLSPLYRVDSFLSAAEALPFLAENPADLVISDVAMPDMDGLELRRRLAKESDTDLKPFVFLTGTDDPTVEREASDLGIDDFLTKPVRREKLLSVVERLLRRSRRLREGLSHRLDDDITRPLAPALPDHVAGFRAVLRFRQASAGGGDLLMRLPETKSGGATLLLFDVMGHGEQAKFFAHAYAGYVNGLARSLPPDEGPGGILSRVSNAVAADGLLRNAIATGLALRLYPDGRFGGASAGHASPLVVRPDRVEELPVDGMLLGLEPKAAYGEVTARLEPGDRLLIYTDGLVEVGKNPEAIARTESVLRKSALETMALPLEAAADAILGACLGPAAEFSDDMTLVILQR